MSLVPTTDLLVASAIVEPDIADSTFVENLGERVTDRYLAVAPAIVELEAHNTAMRGVVRTLRSSNNNYQLGELGEILASQQPTVLSAEVIERVQMTTASLHGSSDRAAHSTTEIQRAFARIALDDDFELHLADLFEVVLDAVKYAGPLLVSGGELARGDTGKYGEQTRAIAHWGKRVSAALDEFSRAGAASGYTESDELRQFVIDTGAQSVHQGVEKMIQSGARGNTPATRTGVFKRLFVAYMLLALVLFTVSQFWQAADNWAANWQSTLDNQTAALKERVDNGELVVYNARTIASLPNSAYYLEGGYAASLPNVTQIYHLPKLALVRDALENRTAAVIQAASSVAPTFGDGTNFVFSLGFQKYVVLVLAGIAAIEQARAARRGDEDDNDQEPEEPKATRTPTIRQTRRIK